MAEPHPQAPSHSYQHPFQQMASQYRRPRPGYPTQYPHPGVGFLPAGATWAQQRPQRHLPHPHQHLPQYHQHHQQHRYNNGGPRPGPSVKHFYKQPVMVEQPALGPAPGMPLGPGIPGPGPGPLAAMPTTPRSTKPRNKSEEAISDLLLRIPDIGQLFDVHSRIGNGTFSTVLLATLRRESHLPDSVRRKFAIKHHIPTSHPDRIMKELQCMTKMGGKDNVVGIHCCLRCDASAAFVMPYMPHDRFHDFYTRMDVAEIRLYMRNLLVALRHVHKFDIIHRDVKPSNFLYNRRRREFLLVDFGLAQHVIQPVSSAAGNNGKRPRERESDSVEQQQQQASLAPAPAETAAVETPPADADLGGAVKRMRLQEEGSKMPLKPINEMPSAEGTVTNTNPNTNPNPNPAQQQPEQIPNQNQNQNTVSASGSKYNTNRNTAGATSKCFCFANPSVCLNCLMKKEVHASRAGTPGYRPPEVLLKYADQTTAVDVWAAGVIFLSIMSSVYPFFKAPNDFIALAEIVTIFGDQAIRQTALALERMVTLSQRSRPLNLRKLCLRFRHRNVFSDAKLLRSYANPDGRCEVCRNCDQYFFNCLCEDSDFVTEPLDDYECFPATAYDLLHRLLEVNPHKRITAEEALQHPFFTAAVEESGDQQQPSNPPAAPLNPQPAAATPRKVRRQRYPKVGVATNEQLKQQLELDIHQAAFNKL